MVVPLIWCLTRRRLQQLQLRLELGDRLERLRLPEAQHGRTALLAEHPVEVRRLGTRRASRMSVLL